jgi:hypothetical protein
MGIQAWSHADMLGKYVHSSIFFLYLVILSCKFWTLIYFICYLLLGEPKYAVLMTRNEEKKVMVWILYQFTHVYVYVAYWLLPCFLIISCKFTAYCFLPLPCFLVISSKSVDYCLLLMSFFLKEENESTIIDWEGYKTWLMAQVANWSSSSVELMMVAPVYMLPAATLTWSGLFAIRYIQTLL